MASTVKFITIVTLVSILPISQTNPDSQCIPAGINKYTEDWVCSLSGADLKQVLMFKDGGQGDSRNELEVGETARRGTEPGMETGCQHVVKLGDVTEPPYVRYSHADNEKQYVLVMADPDAPNCAHSEKLCYWLHWIVTNIPGKALHTSIQLKEPEWKTLMDYAPPTPPSGIHRYQFLLFELEAGMTVTMPTHKREDFDLDNFITENSLCGRLVAGFQYHASARAE